MIRRKLFKKSRMTATMMVAIISASVIMAGCASQESTPVAATATVQTTSVLSETESAVEAQSEAIPEEDGEAPVITVTNTRIEVVEGADINLMDGVSASDENDGDLTGKIGVSEYDTSSLDVEQTITYTVADEAGNETAATAVVVIKSNPIEALDKTMYSTSSVNVRSASSQDGEKLGSLPYVQSVHVTGQDKNTGWYEIEYNNGVGYVSDSYLSDTKPAPKPATTKPASTKTTASSNTNQGTNEGDSSPQPQPSTPAPIPDSQSSNGAPPKGSYSDPNGGFPPPVKIPDREGISLWD